MTLEEAVTLLREAHKVGVEYECWDCGIDEQPVWERIKEALAAHDAVKAAPAEIRWEEKESNRFGIRPHEADYSDNVFLTVDPQWLGDGWLWRVEYVGEANTEAEAKAAAVQYAGRLP
jgi:hypothetical protein